MPGRARVMSGSSSQTAVALRRTEGSRPRRRCTTGARAICGALRTGESEVTGPGAGAACSRGVDGVAPFGPPRPHARVSQSGHREGCRLGHLSLATPRGQGGGAESHRKPDFLDLHLVLWGRERRGRGLVPRRGQGGHHDPRPGQGLGPMSVQAVDPEEGERPGEPAEQHEDAELQGDQCQRRADTPEPRLAPTKASPMARDADTGRHGMCRSGGVRRHALSPHSGGRQGCVRAHFRAVEYAGWVVPAPEGRPVCAPLGWPVGAPVERLVGSPVGCPAGAPLGWPVVAWPGWVTDAQ
ncbi:hypothetical protein FB474_2830 [Oryzihumus leptocrescens]|uniref:Uncharacterized protein n=1 Tax=Oryzihumus leptocrescens TaxID=297536 RepID=A0A542ZMI5_9MICO|nr:hypothetical protein FB474_2830 [Oryzihumus leptocrescens]